MSLLVTGGPAGSGSKRALKERAKPWTCPGCKRENQGFVVRCLTFGCNQPRPT